MVGNNSTLACDITSLQVPISIQGYTFTLNLYHFPLSGADIVLGVQWLKLLGPITTDYSALTMNFTHLVQPIALHVDVPLSLETTSAQQVKRFAQTQSISTLFHLTPISDQA